MIVFVSGATAGFGASTAKRFANSGHRVIAAGRRVDRLDALVRELGRDRVLPLALDVRNRNAVEESIKSLPLDFADIDVLVNNAGLALEVEPAQSAELSSSRGRRSFDT